MSIYENEIHTKKPGLWYSNFRNLQVQMFSHKPRYKCTTTKTMFDTGDHSSLPTSNIIALAYWKRKKKER